MEWPLLASLDEEARRRLLDSAHRRRFARGELVVREGDPSDSLHLVESGRLAVRVTTVDGDTATLNVLGPGDYFGELSLLDGPQATRTASVVALESSATRTVSATGFRELRRTNRDAEQLLLLLLARRVEELSDRLVEAMYADLDRRVHRRLAELAETYGPGDGPVEIPLTQEHLAELVGGTRPSVNQVLQRLAGRGVIALGRGRITVSDRAALRHAAR